MGDTCQVKYMPFDAFAALTLKADPAWTRYAANASLQDTGTSLLSKGEQKAWAVQLELQTRALEADSIKRAQIVHDFWFGTHAAGASNDWRVYVNDVGVPHAVRSNDAFMQRGVPASIVPAGAVAKARRQRRHLLASPDGLYKKLAARQTHLRDDLLARSSSEAALAPPKKAAATGRSARPSQPWCEATDEMRAAKRCPCLYDGLHGALCEGRNEAYCLNQCSGHGQCDMLGGFCHCDEGYFGIDCSMTTGPDGKVTLHAGHAARLAPRSPSVFVYELWDHTSLILQYRAYRGYCAHRVFDPLNRSEFNGGYAYQIETALHEWMLNSPHRTLDGERADFFYMPVYMSCTILPVYDWVGPGPFATGYPARPVTAMRMAHDAMEQVRQRWPYFNRSVAPAAQAEASGQPAPLPNHVVLFSHDEGACWAPQELYNHAVILTHWGRMDLNPRSSSRYPPDNWDTPWTIDQRAPNGQRWTFPARGGSRRMIGKHPCYRPDKDIVLPVFAGCPLTVNCA